MERVFEILNIKYEMKRPVMDLGDEIIFSKVSFRYYEKQKFIVKSLDLSIHPGEPIAIVGRSGCGKTMLVSLLMECTSHAKEAFDIPRKWF